MLGCFPSGPAEEGLDFASDGLDRLAGSPVGAERPLLLAAVGGVSATGGFCPNVSASGGLLCVARGGVSTVVFADGLSRCVFALGGRLEEA